MHTLLLHTTQEDDSVEWQSEEGVSTSTSALRQFLKEKLPEYMIPSAFVRLLRLPLTPNGKVDRKALPAPDQTRPELEGVDYVAPQTPIEHHLVEIWKELLGLERVGIHDNFFELGGHSLLATQLVSRLRAGEEGVEIPLRIVFESPTIAGIADFIEREQQQRLRGQQALSTRSSKWVVGILGVDRSSEKSVMMGVLPLSFAQKRLWFLDQFEPGSSAYNIPSAVGMEGILNVEALEESFVEIIKRHEVLRTIFVSSSTVEGEPRLLIRESVPFMVSLIDLQQLIVVVVVGGVGGGGGVVKILSSEDSPAAETTTTSDGGAFTERVGLASEEARRPFDLSSGTLLRASVLQMLSNNDEDESGQQNDRVLLFNMHHIVSDGWSIQILIKEMGIFYQYLSTTKTEQEDRWLVVEEDVISDLAIQYADFGYWQQQWLQGEVLSEQLKYWKEKLNHGDIPSLQLPTDHSRPAIQTFDGGASGSLELSRSVCNQLQAVCQGGDVTIFMTLLAAFQILLYPYSGGQEHFAIGSPIANRNRMEIEGLIGFFVNTLVLKSDVSPNPTFTTSVVRWCQKDLPGSIPTSRHAIR